MEQEVWKQIKGYEGLYEISNLGRFKSCTRRIVKKNGAVNILKEKIIIPNCNTKDRYVNVCITKNGKAKTIALHILLATAFISNPENKPCINHINGKKKDNALSNLEWVTYSENMIHALDTGLRPFLFGEKATNKKLNEKIVLEIFNNTVDDVKKICKNYNITAQHYDHIKTGYSWSSVTGKVYTGTRKQSNRLKNYIKNLQQ